MPEVERHETDNIIRVKDKATWGFTGDGNGQIVLGRPGSNDTTDLRDTVKNNGGNEETDLGQKLKPLDNDSLPNPRHGAGDSEGDRGNGGGFPDEESVTHEYLVSLTKAKLLDLAKAHEITLDKPKGSKDELVAELAEYYEVKPEEPAE